MTIQTKQISKKMLETALGVSLSGMGNPPIAGFTTDSREATEGMVFLAIPGERFDGNDYVEAALEKGASLAIANRAPQGREDRVVLVEDTVLALGRIAAAHKRVLHPRTVGVTGSVGKTTSKELIYSVLSTRFRTHKTDGNHNNEIGLPLSLLTLDDSYEAAVYEMGMSAKGEISYLTNIVHPDVAVITNVGTMHIEYLGSREAIRDAKLEIREGLPLDGGCLILNGDEPLLQDVHPAVTVGIRNGRADLVAENIRPSDDGGVFFDLRGKQIGFSRLYLPVNGMHNVHNAAMATAVGLHYGLTEEEIRRGLALYRPCGMRQNTYDYQGITILEDCYNAGPESMKAALSVLSDLRTKRSGRLVAVLGDMRELGGFAPQLHREVGDAVASSGVSLLFTVGELARTIGERAAEKGVEVCHLGCLSSDREAAAALEIAACLRAGDSILFKGSRSMHLETLLAKVKSSL